jgi:hypothetical protein
MAIIDDLLIDNLILAKNPIKSRDFYTVVKDMGDIKILDFRILNNLAYLKGKSDEPGSSLFARF